MCVPTVAIREDGKGFLVQKGGVWWEVDRTYNKHDYGDHKDGSWYARNEAVDSGIPFWGYTIFEAVDAAVAKMNKVKE